MWNKTALKFTDNKIFNDIKLTQIYLKLFQFKCYNVIQCKIQVRFNVHLRMWKKIGETLCETKEKLNLTALLWPDGVL